MLVKIVEYHPWVVDFIEAGCFRLLVIPRRSIADKLRDEKVLSGEIVSIIQNKAIAKEGSKKRVIPKETADVARKEGISSFFTPTFSHSS